MPKGKLFGREVGIFSILHHFSKGNRQRTTEIVKKIILDSDFIIGYKYTLNTISDLIHNKEVYEITMENQEKIYQN